MLILSRREDEQFTFPGLGIHLTILRISGNVVRVGIDAPHHVKVLRSEVLDNVAGGSRFLGGKDDLKVVSEARLPGHHTRNLLNTINLGIHLIATLTDQSDAATSPTSIAIEKALGRVMAALRELELSLAIPVAKQPTPLFHLHALLVEDDPNERELLAEFLRAKGMQVATAEDGQQGLDYLASSKRPDVILLDMQTPRLDGPTFISRVRGTPNLRTMRMFAISGMAQNDTGVEIGPQGVDQWFAKPLNPSALANAMAASLN